MIPKRDSSCTLCKLHATAEWVCLLSPGPYPCKVMVCGEAPGKREDETGKAFVGQSGQYLMSVLERFGINRKNATIVNAVSCRPPANRTPTKGEIKACRKWLDLQIQAAKPKFILLLGNTALFSFTGKGGIKARHGKPFEQDGAILVATYHPAAITRSPELEPVFERDIQLFSEIIARGSIPREDNLDYVIVNTERQVTDMLDDLSGTVSFDIETTCLYPWARYSPDVPKSVDAKINTIGFGTRRRQHILPLKHMESKWSDSDIKSILKRIDLKLQDCYVVAHNGKFDFLWVWVHYGYQWHPHFDFDTMLAHYMLDENSRHDLKGLAQIFCAAPNWDVDDDTKRGQTKSLDKLALYQAHDLYYTRKLRFIFGDKLDKEGDVKRVFDYIMMPCARLFTEVEYDGLCINTGKMKDAEKYLKNEVTIAEKEMRKYGDINFGSPQQLAHLLFTKLKIRVVTRTPTGKPSTSESVINQVDHPISAAIIRFRGAKQQLSFFIEGWLPFLVDHDNGRFLHPSFKLHGAVTGRFSSEHPNCMQIPRDERIRSLVTTPDGWTLIEADLSQIELRIVAELANEPTMLEAFLTGKDIHWMTCLREIERGGGMREIVLDTARTATQNKSLSYSESIEVLLELGPGVCEEINKDWKELRKKAKAINFGYTFGMWYKKFKIYARDNYGVHLTDEEAQESRRFFFDTYKLVPWHDRQKRFARLNGYVRSLSGRKRRLPQAQLRDDTPERREAERQSINCVSIDTEILTEHGWKTVDQLSITDYVFSMQMRNGSRRLQLQPLVGINRGHYKGKMWQIDHNSISALTTPNHRWPIKNNHAIFPNTAASLMFRTSAELSTHGSHKLILDSQGLLKGQKKGGKTTWTNDEVQLMGWVLTDGSYRKRGKHQSNSGTVIVCQSKPKYLSQIHQLFRRLGKTSRSNRRPGFGHRIIKNKHVSPLAYTPNCWSISHNAGERMKRMMPDKTLTMEVLLSMNHHQRVILFETMLKGDGGWTKKIQRFRRICTGSKKRAEAFLMLCALIGKPARIFSRDLTGYKPISPKMRNIPKMGITWHVELTQRTTAQPQYGSKWVDADCEVWCPTTIDGTWIAKRNNKMFITGNSPVQGFANEINLMAAIQLREEYGRDKVRICATVHDAILLWCKNKHIQEVSERLLKIMSRPKLFDVFDIDLKVPISAEVKIGDWSQGVSLQKWLKQQRGK